MAETKMPTAHTLEDAVNSDNSLEGYAAMNTDPDHSEIAKLAYQLYEERGGHHGGHEEDWLEAERQYRQRKNSKGSSANASKG